MFMDGCSGKRASERQPDTKKGSGIILRDRFNSGYNNVPICSRDGCIMGKNPMKGTWIGSTNRKGKSVLSSFCSSSNGKEIIGTSSKTRGSASTSTKSEKKPMIPQMAMDSSDSSSTSSEEDESVARILDVHKKGFHRRLGSGNIIHEKHETTGAECSILTSSLRTRRGFRPRFGLNDQGFRAGPSGQAPSANTVSRHGLRNRSCRSMLSGVIPSGFGLEKRPSHARKSFGESSSSSSRGKNITEPPAQKRCYGSNLRVSITDNRRPRNFVLNSKNDVTSVGTRRSVIGSDASARFSTREAGRRGLSSITIPEMSQTETSTHHDSPVSLELFRGFREVGFHGSLMSQDNFHGYNLDGIPEILPELDRIERDIELNYEDLLVIETGLLLGGLSFHDRHRDMRLDIDNMSYEELLALEERIGSVSIALSEEAISKCMERSIYQITVSDNVSKDDAKCSICQEEYTEGDEVGRLHCKHRYHVGCVQEWLRLKNWCPICRASAEPSSE
ncbi:PREDICTED: E3 ubiquitin-protein ligase RLIM-like [Tarenaya hassleriana]|uniref:E3 ubiquitin-protein ligase RLIM-like n=1 Tax=Tarenaya hassleriana TaxID=28532 RepID=UPI00053CA39C|nr:PREDICTED: E3 ubiquitin-protein ligase RLIM-like [Tarenaya hassleriana]